MPNLALDPNLTTYAQQWANYLAANNVFMHRDSLPATPGTSPATNSYWTINNPYYTQQYLGENIFSGTGYPTTVTTPPGTDAVASWISEKQYYSYAADSAPNPPPPAPATFGNGASNSPPGCTAPQTKFCGHYTQVVYRTTTYVGCGKATGSAGWTYVVCNFYPAGNYQGALPY
ncbi:MAG TPA: CAP domain-containing protein [Methylocella sp.]|nr:CAP domain-containing protein [Methylocella sp.]